MPAHELGLRSLTFATDIDVLGDDSVVERRGDHVLVRTPTSVSSHWGNFLLYDGPPGAGDRARWEAAFEREILREQPGTVHRAFGWDVVDGARGAADAELAAAGYVVEEYVGLVATAADLTLPARANGDARVRTLDPAPGADARAWHDTVELQVANRQPGFEEAVYRRFCVERVASRRAVYAAGRGSWFGAWLDDRLVATLGVVVTHGRARYQSVDSHPDVRRRGLASRLVHAAGLAATEQHGAERLVIVTEADNHALGVYRGVGFRPAERSMGARWWPTAVSGPADPASPGTGVHGAPAPPS